MPNTLLTPNWYTTDVATGFLDSTKLFGRFNRDLEDEWSDLPKGAKIGDGCIVATSLGDG